mgnify:CR=1 FL=1
MNKTKKPTIRDVAKAAGVSVATVSYVINDKKSESISEQTIKKVKQSINLLGFVPNQAARSLTKRQTFNVAFISSPELTYLQKLDLMNFLEPFSAYLLTRGYNLLYIYQTNIEEIKDVDAIICYNMEKEQFYALGDVNIVPMIAIDMVLNDPIFYQINKDYEAIYNYAATEFGHDNYTLITIKPHHSAVTLMMNEVFKNIIYVSLLEDVIDIINNNRNLNILLIDPTLFNVFKAISPKTNVVYYNLRFNERYEKIFDTIQAAINRSENLEHFIKI